jgi:hypothetical protein
LSPDGCCADLAEIRRVDIRGWDGEYRVIQHIGYVGAEFQSPSFVDFHSLVQIHIELKA